MKKSLKFLLKVIILAIFLLILALIFFKVFPIFKDISTDKGRLEFEEFVLSLGIKGPLVIIALMFLQITIVFLPGEPVQMLAGICYGPFLGTFYILLGSILSSTLAYILVKKYGTKLLYNFFEKKDIKKITKSKLYNNHKTVNLIMFIGFFVPGLPKDLIVWVAGLLPTNLFTFLIISTVGRIPSVFIAAIAGRGLVEKNYLLIVVSYAILFIISGIIIVLSKDFRKKDDELVRKKKIA